MSVTLVILGVLLTGVLVVSFTLYSLQEKFILHAEKLSLSHNFRFAGEFDELNLMMSDGVSQNGVLFKTKNPKGLIMLMHGHSGNVEHWGTMGYRFNKLHYDLLVIDYRGYGKSEGKFSEQDTFLDVEQWYRHMNSIYSEAEISLYGKGIGATFASYLASEFTPNKLILESPLYDLKFTALKYYPLFPFIQYIPTFKFNTATYFKKIQVPVYMVHGKLNKLVHYENSTRLLATNTEHADLCLIKDGDHHNLVKHPAYIQYIVRILGT